MCWEPRAPTGNQQVRQNRAISGWATSGNVVVEGKIRIPTAGGSNQLRNKNKEEPKDSGVEFRKMEDLETSLAALRRRDNETERRTEPLGQPSGLMTSGHADRRKQNSPCKGSTWRPTAEEVGIESLHQSTSMESRDVNVQYDERESPTTGARVKRGKGVNEKALGGAGQARSSVKASILRDMRDERGHRDTAMIEISRNEPSSIGGRDSARGGDQIERQGSERGTGAATNIRYQCSNPHPRDEMGRSTVASPPLPRRGEQIQLQGAGVDLMLLRTMGTTGDSGDVPPGNVRGVARHGMQPSEETMLGVQRLGQVERARPEGFETWSKNQQKRYSKLHWRK